MMDDLTTGLDPDLLMDLEDPDGSDMDDEDEEFADEPLPSPLQLPSSGPGSTTTSITSSPPNNEDFLPPFNCSGKPLSSLKRGRGRPKRDGGKSLPRKQSVGSRGKKPRAPGASRGGLSRRFKSLDRDFEVGLGLSSEELAMLDQETAGSLLYGDKPSLPSMDDVPYAPELWPGKVCAYCNLGERSQLGQGELLRLNCPEGFIPQRMITDSPTTSTATPEKDAGDKSPRGPVTCRRQKSFNKCRHPSLTSEYIDELTIIGYSEEPHVSVLYEQSGHFYVHRNCALWSDGVVKNEHCALENVGPVVLQSSSRKCSFCNHYGASVFCKADGCSKIYHYPCATASGAFQELPTLTTYCSNHLGHAGSLCESSVCNTCKSLGDLANLTFCSSCGDHYHGTCVGLAQLPGVRAGWQCRKCRNCQVCRSTGDESKLMTCEQCDKVYHAGCQRPIVTTIPKYGWKCRCCRVCGDCGSRTPGAGLSSRWHAHYTVCDSCYQQRNKGFFCPICRRAYRAHAHREMVQCTSCNKFVHGTCDPEADLSTYNQKKEANPEYDYVCSSCKSISRSVQPITSKRNSIEDGGDSLSASQESLYDDLYDFDASCSDVSIRSLGLGKGKPYSALKLANNKKRLGYASSCSGALGRPKGSFGKGLPGKVGFIKRQRLADFGRKRGQKSKMRGMFGFPGVGLQRPTSTDGRAEEEPGGENRLVLCSASDKFALMQDVCVMCGAFGTDQEGCLIGCVQCGQCYHPYCVNVKVTKVILEKGWRCLDCTICEGCGLKTDEPRLILCDECDISYHTYCVDPPLDYVPQGTWKCNSCVMCQMCGATDPGFNCTWMNSFSECGPCASQVSCSSCNEPYIDGDIILKCTQCERWSHGGCDSIKTEEEADICVQDGYNCVLCRPRDVPPPHLIPVVSSKPPTPTKSPEVKATNYFLDGIHLSEWGHNLIKSLTSEHSTTRKKRKKLPTVQDKEAGILATIESVVAGGSCEGSTSLEDTPKLEIVDVKDEPQEQYKEGMIWTKEDGPPPDGFTVFTMESGVSVLRRKRQRNLQKMGIGGFLVRVRGNNRTGQENDDIDVLPGQTNLPCSEPGTSNMTTTGVQEGGDKPKRKPVRRKPKSKLSETFPPYLQEAFFGKDLLDSTKELASSSSDEEKITDVDKTIHLSQEEMKAVAAISIKKEEKPSAHNIMDFRESLSRNSASKLAPLMLKEEVEENSEDIKDMFGLPKDFIDPELVNTIMNDNDELTKNAESLEALTADANLPDDADITDTLGSSGNSKDTKDELSDILGSHFNLDAISNINSKDVEDIFKGVLTDESQESQESNAFPLQSGNIFQSNTPQPVLQHPMVQPPMRPNTLPAVQSNLNSPLSFPAQSPYQSEYSNSPQFSPAFSEANANWVSPVNNVPEPNESEVATNTKTKSGTPAPTRASNNQRSSEKMKADEGLGNLATISAVLYANVNHPEWKKEFPIWSDRYKQMIKKWRTLPNDQKTPYLQQARDNRSALRMKKQQQSQPGKESIGTTVTSPTPKVAATSQQPVSLTGQIPAGSVAPVSEDQEKMSSQQKSAKEAEQERQWKHMQAMRLQQAQQQQHNIHEQRVQAIARAQSNQQFLPDLQVNTALQELSPSASPSPRQFPSLGMKSPPFQHPSVSTLRPNVPTSSHDYTTNTPDSSDPYAQQPSTPKPQTPMFQTRPTGDSFIQQQPPTRPQFSLPRSAIQSIQTRQETPDINNHLRDLLQRQQFKKLDEQLLAGKGHQRLWPPTETQDSADIPVTSTTGSADGTFRQPLPPPGIRPRQPTALPNLPRQALIGLRMQPVQNMDNRMRMLMQQQQQVKQRLALPNTGNQVQQFPQVGGTAPVRFPMGTPGRPSSIDQFEQIIQRQQPVTSQRNIVDQTHTTSRLQLAQNQHLIAKIPVAQQQATPSLLVANASASDQEIPDNVTAELEKLEQETGTMEELHGVSDILGGLGDDDDELLAEMGADFNILEYADPELEALAGEKTNILDLELEEEPMKKEKTQTITPGPATSQVRPTPLPPAVMQQSVQQQSPVAPEIKKENVMPQLASSTVTPPTQQQQPVVASSSQPPPLVLPQQNQNLVHPVQPSAAPLLQQIHQHMIQQVQQAAAQNRPMAPGSRLQTPDGVTGIVTPNNNVQLHVPPNYQRILLSQLQNQKLQMRIGQSLPRMLNPPTSNLHSSGIPMGAPRLGVPPPPPPPYPGPPPPYPGSSNGSQQQMGLRMGPFPLHHGGHVHHIPSPLPNFPPQRRPLLLEEQPLLLEDLLEQEKREQEKQIQSHNVGNQPNMGQISNSETALLSDHDFERLKADVFDNNLGLRDPAPPQQVNPSVPQNLWQHAQNQRPTPSATPAPPPAVDVQPRVQLFNINPLPAPPLPPENIITEQDKQTQMFYEQWLNNQNNILTQQLRYYETEVQKLRKSRKSLNSKQRQLKKSGNSLNEVDATELQRIQSEQSILQKHLESSRKQTRQHGMLIQEYRNKQAKQHPGQVPSPHMLNQPGQSPLGPPASSPIHHPNSSQSPMMSPSASMSPLTQHNSPLHSPGNLLSQSPGPSSVPNLLQSPSSLAGSGMSPMQPSPRIGTPQSQNDSPVHSPSQICLPPPVPRMTSPQHRRVVTSPVAYSNDLRQGATQMRFIRTPINDHSSTLQQRVVRMSSPSSYQQKPGTPSPLNSPPPSQQLNITQHILQKQLHQQALLHQQQQQGGEGGSNENPIGHFQRANQLVKQRNMLRQQQQQQHQNQQQIGQPQPLTPQQHQLMIQQQQQLAKQQQQHIAQFQAQARLNQLNNQPPKSPMPPKSPLVQQQMMSPHSMPPSPMPPRSPMMTFVNNQQHQQSQNQPPHSPIARSPSYHQGMSGQPPSSPMTQHQSPSPVPRSPMMNQILSPMSMRRQPSTPDMPDRPMSVERPTSVERPLSIENPGTPRTPSYFMDNSQGGGGNGNNPIPAPPSCDRIGYIKLGLRGGTPMWNLGRGAKRVPTPPANNSNDKISPVSRAIKKDTIHNKVTILKKKSAVKLQTGVIGKISSLVSSDYNDLDDSSSTPPVTPPPIASTSRLSAQKKVCDAQEVKDDSQIVVLDNSAEDIMDYDDDNSTVLSTEVSLNSAAQNDADEIMETLSQSDLTDVMSSPLGSAQISDEYLLFHGNVVDIEGEEQYFDKDATEEHEYVGEDMHIVIRSPTTSDDEYIMQEKGRKYGMQTISSPLLSITETPDSPEQEEINTDPSPEPEEMDSQNYEDSQNIVLIDQSMKISKEQISTKVDFEELIDEGSRKQNLLKSSVISVSDINDFHKFTNQTYSIQQQKPSIQVIQKSVSATLPRHTIKQIPQKVSIITAPVIHNVATVSASDVKITTCLQNRSNVLTIPKLVSSVPPVITIVSASSSQMSSMLPSGFTGPVISATAVRNLTNVKVIDKPTSSLSLSHDNSLPKKIFEDDSVSPDSSNCEDDKKDSSDEKSKNESPPVEVTRRPNFPKIELQKPEPTVKIVAIEHTSALKRRDVSIMQSEGKEMMSTYTATENLIDTKEHQKKVMENVMAEKRKKVPSPIISKTLSTAIIHNTPELKMTAQVIQESQPSIQISGRSGNDSYELSSSEDTKSVVISIPSPTPSQEQMLDNITLQAIEKRRRDGKGIPSGFESFEDVLDMIENITGEPPTVLEDNIKDKIQDTNVEIKSKPESAREKILSNNKREMSMSIAASTMSNIKASTMPQLSPLSQPTDLTTNMANASQQLRTLLSLHTSSSSSSTETIAKSELHKPTSSVIISAAPVVTSRIIQHIGKPTSTTSSTVIVPNVKTSPISSVINNVIKSSASSPAFSTISNSQSHNLATGALTTQRSISSFHLIPDISKSTSATSVSGFTTNSSLSSGTLQKTSVISSTPSQSDSRKGALSLTAMLQSHPAASSTASSSTESFTAASLLGSMSLSKTNFNTSLVQAQPNIILAQATANSANSASARIISLTSTAPPLIPTARTTSSTNLLHTQLTKVLKKPDTQKMEIVDAEETKHETKEDSFIAEIKQEITSGCRSFNISTPVHMSRGEDSQNVLLKKLLQNTGCASTQSIIISSNPSVSATSSVFTTASTLDSQIAKVTPTLASLLPTVVKTEPGLTPPPSKPQTPIQKQTLMSRETSFVSNPVIQQLPTSSTGVVTSQPLHIDIKKCMPPSRTPSRDDLLSPQTPRSSCSQDSSLQTPPLIIKKEMNQTVPQSPILTPQEVKREFMDETSQHSEVSDHSRSEVQVKEENESMDSMTEKMILDQKEELKKQKRRLYQQKRRLNQQQSKEAQAPPKKRPRKSSKADEDYDAYVDGVLAQMRSLPPMNVTEPVLNRNFGVVPVFGIGDTSKLGTKEHDSRFGELNGTYGNAVVPGFLDYYETKPFGDLEKLPEIPPVSTQRGFYNLEFPPIKFDNEETKRFDLFCREDSPDIIEVSSCTEDRGRMPNSKLIGLKLICDDDEDEQELKNSTGRVSPAVTILAPTPIRLKSTSVSSPEESPEVNKENIGGELCVKSKSEQGNTPQSTPVKDPDNVTVTLTLTSSAAENIMGVLRDLANILHIPAPTSYQIVERSPTPPSQKLGLYRTKGKDGKEGAPIDIQSILNGAAKFCKHCDVVILCNMIKKKVSELPFLYKDSELMGDGDDLYFCSTSCYMQFALMNRSPLIAEDKAAAIIDHLCQKDKAEQRARNDPFDPKNLVIEKMTLGKELSRNEERALAMFARPFNSRRGEPMDTSKTTNTWKGIRYKSYSLGCLQPRSKYKKPTDKETMELLYKLGLTLTPPKGVEDTRRCMFCHVIGDGVADGPGRLLNYDVDKWVHLNCALWSEGVYETVNGALMNLDNALRQSTVSTCIHCLSLGATVRCFKTRCSSVYHLNCAVKDNCVFFKNKTTFCAAHVPKNEKDNELTTLSVSRRVYVNRDENRQVANIMHNSDTNSILRVGSLIFLNVGQLLPHQLQNFHTPNFIYPIGYKIIRFYWSIRYVNKRCRYVCSINESFGIPEFSVLVQEPPEEDIEFKDTTPRAIWTRIVEKVSALRLENGYVKTFAKFVNGEDMFGLTEPAVVRVLESLPGIETLTDYKFKYGRNPLLELPLAINPTGSARSEARLRNQQHWKRHHTQRSGGSSLRPLFGPTPPGPTLSTFSEVACPYSKQFVHSKSSQYKKMKQEWRNNVYLARSKIQGLGLYAARDLEKHTMVIEYIGEIIRTELAETREKKYEARNRGIYMFRLDEERVVDATLSGGLARYINHSCNPNCVAETVEVDRDFKIIIFAKRRIQRGEELSYDYKFDIEDDQHKISCMCGAPNCRKWMN